MSAWVWTFHQLKPHPFTHSLTHPFICNSPSLSTTQEQGWTQELERERIGKGIEEGNEEEEEKHQHHLMDTINVTSSTSSMVSSRGVALISWISLQMPNLWLLAKSWRFLVGGGSIIWSVSSRDLYLTQSPNCPMDYPLIHFYGILQDEAHMKSISLWMKKQRWR